MTVSSEQVFDILRTIPDPEMPVSILDLGLVEDVRVDCGGNGDIDRREAASGGGARVGIDLLPTFIGCPALDMIAGDVRAKVGQLAGVQSIEVRWLHDPAWSVDRITAAGRESLKVHGVTVPESGSHLHVAGHEAPQTVALRTSAIACPFCGSSSTYLDSAFGPTRCRMIYYCDACRNSFEHLKRV